jgi:hypothetical protein
VIAIVHCVCHCFNCNSVLPKAVHSIPRLIGEESSYWIGEPVPLERILGLTSGQSSLAHVNVARAFEHVQATGTSIICISYTYYIKAKETKKRLVKLQHK